MKKPDEKLIKELKGTIDCERRLLNIEEVKK